MMPFGRTSGIRRSFAAVATCAALLLFACALLAGTGQQRGVVTMGKKQPAQRNSYLEAVRLNNLGVAYMNQQQMEKALQLFVQAYKTAPKLTVARLNQAIALLNLQRQEQANTVLMDALRLRPQDARAWYNLGLHYRATGEQQKAIEAFNKVAEIDSGDPDTFYFLGVLHSQAQQYQEAIAAFERALKIAPYHVSSEFGLARALQRSGKPEEARQHLARFEEITQKKLGAPISLVYGEQGKYSLAESVHSKPEGAPPAIPVRFTDVTRQAGLKSSPMQKTLPEGGTADLSGGGCWFDFNNDTRPDLVFATANQREPFALYRNVGNGRFTRATDLLHKVVLEKSLLQVGMGCAASDYDNDGYTDLALASSERLMLLRNQVEKNLADVTEQIETAVDSPFTPGFVDFDHDGDLDLYLTRTAGTSALLRNNGNARFVNWSEQTGLGVAEAISAILSDVNNDRAVDLIVTGGAEAVPRVFLNPREGRFRVLDAWPEKAPSIAIGVAVLDFNKDGWMDVAFTHGNYPCLTLWRNVRGEKFELADLPDYECEQAWGLAALDYDNDGWLDLVAIEDQKWFARVRTEDKNKAGRLRLLRNVGGGKFEDVSVPTGLSKLQLERPRSLVTADYDSDGDTDLLITQNFGPPVLLRNDGGNRNNWLRIALKGLNDNKSAIGTKVEVFAGALWQKFEVQGASGFLGQNSTEIVVGLGRERQVDVVRMLWPTGVLQDEVEIATRTRRVIDEIDRRGSSCPVLFAWDGERYRFITDVIGAGIVGHWVAPGTRNTPDPNEYVKVDGTLVRPRDGYLSFRLMEPMEEVVFLDQVRLFAVDHPSETEIYPNEYFAGAPPFPEFKLIAARDARPPRSAVADNGRNVLPELLYGDRSYVTDFRPAAFKGFAQLHTLELELPELYDGGPLRLLMHGFTDYFTATSVYAAHQANMRPVVPYLEAEDNSGRWLRVSDNIGFPAGLLRTMTVDLTDKLPKGTRQIRISTNLKIYWDQILIDTSAAADEIKLTEVPLAGARLAFHGYPREQQGSLPGDVSYVYEEVSLTGPYARHAGLYTRYGDVRPLLTKIEDDFVILGSGDEVALDFDSANLPPVPPGWRRDYLFYVHGYNKDMDFYEAHPQTVEPLPYAAMDGYPYQHRKPDAKGTYLDYRLRYNTRAESGKTTRGFRSRFDRLGHSPSDGTHSAADRAR